MDKQVTIQSVDTHILKSAGYDLMMEIEQKKMTIARVHPSEFRELQYMVTVSPDVLNPRSSELERAYNLEEYDRMVVAPPGMFDPEQTAKLLLTSSPKTNKDPDKYLAKQPAPGQLPMPGGQGQMPTAGNSPLNAVGAKPPTPAAPALAGLAQ